MVGPLTIAYPVRPARRSLATAHVADLFGLAADPPPHPVAENLSLDIRSGDVVLLTGPSGGGKSSLLRELGRRLNAADLAAVPLADAPLVDQLPGPVDERIGALTGCGLGEARLMLRTPAELSDGQRWRFRLAVALAGRPGFLLADEFAALLDRPTAQVVAFGAQKLARRAGVGLLAATSHDDLSGDLNPDLLVRCGPGGVTAERAGGEKKKPSGSPINSGCPTVPEPTGRTSLGGITAATGSGS